MASSISSKSSSSSTNIRHVRSISLPSRLLHPTTFQVEEEIAYLKSCETSSSSSTVTVESVSDSLRQLEKLYTSLNDLLTLPQTQQALLRRKDDKLMDELLDRSVGLLDVCGFVRDVMEQVKEHIRNVQSALRRGKEGVLKSDASSILKMKDVKRAVLALKQIDNTIAGIALLDLDHHLSSLIKSLRDICALSVSIFGSLLMSLTAIFVSKPKATKWNFVSDLIHKRARRRDQSYVPNEGLEYQIEGIEESLESMSRTLINARVCLLNIRSH